MKIQFWNFQSQHSRDHYTRSLFTELKKKKYTCVENAKSNWSKSRAPRNTPFPARERERAGFGRVSRVASSSSRPGDRPAISPVDNTIYRHNESGASTTGAPFQIVRCSKRDVVAFSRETRVQRRLLCAICVRPRPYALRRPAVSRRDHARTTQHPYHIPGWARRGGHTPYRAADTSREQITRLRVVSARLDVDIVIDQRRSSRPVSAPSFN